MVAETEKKICKIYTIEDSANDVAVIRKSATCARVSIFISFR